MLPLALVSVRLGQFTSCIGHCGFAGGLVGFLVGMLIKFHPCICRELHYQFYLSLIILFDCYEFDLGAVELVKQGADRMYWWFAVPLSTLVIALTFCLSQTPPVILLLCSRIQPTLVLHPHSRTQPAYNFKLPTLGNCMCAFKFIFIKLGIKNDFREAQDISKHVNY